MTLSFPHSWWSEPNSLWVHQTLCWWLPSRPPFESLTWWCHIRLWEFGKDVGGHLHGILPVLLIDRLKLFIDLFKHPTMKRVKCSVSSTIANLMHSAVIHTKFLAYHGSYLPFNFVQALYVLLAIGWKFCLCKQGCWDRSKPYYLHPAWLVLQWSYLALLWDPWLWIYQKCLLPVLPMFEW